MCKATLSTRPDRKPVAFLSTEPPPLRSAMKPHPSGRRHTDGLLEEKRRVQFLSQPPKVGESLRGFRLRGSLAALENSLSMSRSLFNPNMSVTESGLGTSVRPGQIKMHKKGQRGHRILCLDGGGIKVCSSSSSNRTLCFLSSVGYIDQCIIVYCLVFHRVWSSLRFSGLWRGSPIPGFPTSSTGLWAPPSGVSSLLGWCMVRCHRRCCCYI